MKNAKEHLHVNEFIGDVFNALSSPPGEDGDEEEEATASGYDSVEAVFTDMPNKFIADAAAGVDVVFQYIISGSGGGEWSCAIKDSKCEVKSGQHEKATCTLKMNSTDFTEMMSGKLSPMQAFSSGKLIIKGDIMKSQLIEKIFNF